MIKLICMTYTKKRNIIVTAMIFLAGILAGGRLIAPKILPQVSDGSAPNDAEVYTVTSVIDGDTFHISEAIRVRLMGINSPDKGECYYQQAKQALQELIEGKQVKLEKDITDKDDYGRWLRYAILQRPGEDNILLNDYLVRNGYAFDTPIPPDKHYRELLASAEEQAKRNKLGLWLACDFPEDNEAAAREVDAGPTDAQCIIKGNISEKGFGKTYLIPGCDNYLNVKVDVRKGEQYFCTEEEALDAGFRKATNCP
ncbi:hypothetical protein CO134_03680 [Candidatus Kuenenbacteria bacterium CG_4_9_14_3_um_filter_39_14]|uniref:TNase-like domain-containing protein n=3 Tax=Candidatus Kueneniibacteriota TaxID=1752740 RepID=A0A2M7MHI0_9BACT|nr:MAG: hypothetical protein COZ26_01305 [Candidatus Kuenenbacteria bacterium CG_4_10_14_3_um_filter_39_14]PJA91768.1 MAG: hypothetical protein CO134_03680 [Candidatus Kuenenbacteria bacterium CG_4_9_14_3_um_filter_39_14]